MKIRVPTLVTIFVVGGVLLALNLRIPNWMPKHIATDRLPEDADIATKFLFFRGWPFVPCFYCTMSLSRWDVSETAQFAAYADVGILLFATLLSASFCERICRLLNQGTGKSFGMPRWRKLT